MEVLSWLEQVDVHIKWDKCIYYCHKLNILLDKRVIHPIYQHKSDSYIRWSLTRKYYSTKVFFDLLIYFQKSLPDLFTSMAPLNFLCRKSLNSCGVLYRKNFLPKLRTFWTPINRFYTTSSTTIFFPWA